MRIVLDLQGLQTRSRYRGIGRYTLSFTKALIKNASHHEFWIVLNHHLPESIAEVTAHFEKLIPRERIRTFSLPRSFTPAYQNPEWKMHIAEYVRESFIAELKPDFIYVSSFAEGWVDNAVTSMQTLDLNIPTAVSFYDLIPLLKSNVYLKMPGLKKWYLKKLASLQQAKLLFAISDYANHEAVEVLKIAPSKIITIHAAASDIFRPMQLQLSDVNDLKQRYRIQRPYILYNGGIESRKNVANLLQAFALLPMEIRSQYDLVLVGKSLENDKAQLEKLIHQKGLHEQVIITEYISDDDLVKLYNQCELFVFPSFMEGFGLPPLEAMACGAPVIASNTTSLPEVIGLTEALFNPTSPQSIADKILKVLTEQSFREKLRQHALIQKKKFSWDASAKKAIAAIEKCQVVYRGDTAQSSYSALINKIVSLPKIHKISSDIDFMLIAEAIAKNTKN